MMTTKPKHSALKHAWADGKIIQYYMSWIGWLDTKEGENPNWGLHENNLRIKPEPPREPVRAWACIENGRIVLQDTKAEAEHFKDDGTEVVLLIEEGWTKMVPHDEMAPLPFFTDIEVVIRWEDGRIGACRAIDLSHDDWLEVRYFSIILPMPEPIAALPIAPTPPESDRNILV